MGRPRKFGHIVYGDFRWAGAVWNPDSQYRPDPGESMVDVTWPQALRDKWRRQAGLFQNQPKQHLYERASDNPNRPFAVAIVLDALMRLDPRGGIVPSDFARELNIRYPFFLFHANTVGKILAGLLVEAHNQPRPDQGFSPMESVRAGGTTTYYLDPNNASWIWLANQREWWGDEAERWMKMAAETGAYPEEDPWQAIPDFEWNKQAFDAPDRAPRHRNR